MAVSSTDTPRVTDSRHLGWRPAAAYLYVLHLDDRSLAWEYLRRNTGYREAWQQSQHGRKAASGTPWGLCHLEDPALDARHAAPAWIAELSGRLAIQPDDEPRADPLGFRLWQLPGHKQLMHDGVRLLLTTHSPVHTVHLALSPRLEDGMAYVYAISAGKGLHAGWRRAEPMFAMLEGDGVPEAVVSDRPGRNALLSMRSLQVLDGLAAGASHRELADALFGAAKVAADWHEDSELRAQVRRLVRRGNAFVAGDYRRLLGDEGQKGR